LPKYLCIQLKRFDYDWESNRYLKVDDYFEFPWCLDIEPYTYEGINKTNIESENEQSPMDIPSPIDNSSDKKKLYDLVGIIVHSGLVNAGHYYSYIRGPLINNNKITKEQELEELEEFNRNSENNNDDPNNKNESSTSTSGSRGNNAKWYKFNDTLVEEFEMTEQAIIEECFGGTFTQVSDYKMLPEERIRSWNGYMLFYKECESNSNDCNQNNNNNNNSNINKIIDIPQLNQQPNDDSNDKSIQINDSLSELTELVSKGDEKGLFRTLTSLPPAIEETVKAENLEFCKNKAIYDQDYFDFIYILVKVFKENDSSKCDMNGLPLETIKNQNDSFAVECCTLGLNFLFNTFLKTGKKLRTEHNQMFKWLELFKELLHFSKQSAITFIDYIVSREMNSSFIRHYLLECSLSDIREVCGDLFESATTSLIKTYQINPLTNETQLSSLLTSCVNLLDKTVIDLCKNSGEYFKFLYNYANMSTEATSQLISMGLFNKLLCFLLGNPGSVRNEESSATSTSSSSSTSSNNNNNNNRRWSSIQVREFATLHELIASLVLKCNIIAMRSCELEDKPIQIIDDDLSVDSSIKAINELDFKDNDQQTLSSDSSLNSFEVVLTRSDLIVMPQEMQIYLHGALSTRYLKELVFTFEQINHNYLTKTFQMILSCCYCNEVFSANMIQQILIHIHNSSSNEIKQVLNMLNGILLIEDPLQLKRLCLVTDGYKGNDIVYNGLLSIVRQNQSSDAKKSYQCVKFIVTLANKSGVCRDYLLKTASNWEWSVNWLKNKMLESLSNNSNNNNNNNNGYSNQSWNVRSQSNEDSDTRTFQRTKSAQVIKI
jgi:ubiquitin carboxyl-terminal hydrolase 9/24